MSLRFTTKVCWDFQKELLREEGIATKYLYSSDQIPATLMAFYQSICTPPCKYLRTFMVMLEINWSSLYMESS
jgi:hypothetical protein